MTKKIATNLSPELAEKLYTALVRCRKFDEKIVELYPQQEMKCPTHLSIGQEGVATGVCSALKKSDIIFSTHRSHAHAIAKGGDFKIFFAELYGKQTGCAHGKGGSMHFVQKEIGLYGSSAIVGGNMPVATGAALALQMRKKDSVAVAFFGDGAAEEGTFHESLNFAALRKLPVLFVCENNFIATCTHLSSRQPNPDIYKKADSYGIPGILIDGTRTLEVYETTKKAVERARKGKGPTLIEARCYRWKEHVGPNEDHHLGHRTKEELEKWKNKCPVRLFKNLLHKKKILSEMKLKKIDQKIDHEINEAIRFAKESPFPSPEALYEDL